MNLTLGQVCQKKEGFLPPKKHSDRAQVHLFAVSMCQNHVVSDDCCGMLFCANCTRLPLLYFKFLTYYYSLVAGLLPFLWRHIRTVFIENFLFIHNSIATLIYGQICRVGVVYWTVLCYYPYLASLLFADLLSQAYTSFYCFVLLLLLL